MREVFKQDEKDIPPGEIHVSSICYNCVRRCHRQVTGPVTFDDRAKLKMAAGTEMHKRQIYACHELPCDAFGVKGTVDEYDPGRKLLIDKKFTFADYPEKLPYPHNVKQLEYYTTMMRENGHPIERAVLLYWLWKFPSGIHDGATRQKLTNDSILSYELSLRPNDEIKLEILEKVVTIKNAGPKGFLACPATPSRSECGWCPGADDCPDAWGKAKPAAEGMIK